MKNFTLLIIFLSVALYSQDYLSFGQPDQLSDDLEKITLEENTQENLGIKYYSRTNNAEVYNSELDQSLRQATSSGRLYNKNVKATVLLIHENGSGGTGIIIDENTILTNWHVVDGAEWIIGAEFNPSYQYIADIPEEQGFWAEVVAIDMDRDLALLKVESRKFRYTFKNRFARNNSIDVADQVFAIGHPDGGALWTYTDGKISRELTPGKWSYDGRRLLEANIIQTQTPINPGNSGGPLYDVKGYLVGINSWVATEVENINYSVRIDEIKDFIKRAYKGQYLKHNHVNIQWQERDLNDFENPSFGNERVTHILDRDENLDGVPDTRQVYVDEDIEIGWVVRYFDADYDGVWDMLQVYDEKSGGILWYFDEDSDGTFEVEGFDTNGDGWPDEYALVSN